MEDIQFLGQEIIDFLATHGKRNANDPQEWSSPDACSMEDAAVLLINRMLPDNVPFSEWGSGGYKPYNDKRAKQWHDRLLDRIRTILAEVKS
jgi:hypothetical protein